MKKEVDVEKYNELCDNVRSLILYAETFKRRNTNRRITIQELIELTRSDGIELVRKIKALEGLINSFCGIKVKNDS